MSGACTGKLAAVRVKSFRHSHQEDTNQATTTTKFKINKENNHSLFQVSTPSPYLSEFMQIQYLLPTQQIYSVKSLFLKTHQLVAPP